MCWNGSGEKDHHLSGAARWSPGRKANPCGARGTVRMSELRSSHADCCRTGEGGSQCRYGHSAIPWATALIRCAHPRASPHNKKMRRRPRPWSQVLFVGKLPGLAAANGLRTAGVLCANGGVPRQLPPSPRDSGGHLRDQPRTTAPSRGPLKGRHERIPTWAHSQVKQILDLLNGLQRGDDHRPVVHVGNRHAVNQ